jgi:hypothetical protein
MSASRTDTSVEDGRYNRERRCSISGPGDLLKGVDLDSQKSVNNSQPVS